MDDQDAVFSDEAEQYETQASPKQTAPQNYVENAEVHNTAVEGTSAGNKRPPPIVPIVIASGSQFSIDKENPLGDNKPDIFVDRPEYMHQGLIYFKLFYKPVFFRQLRLDWHWQVLPAVKIATFECYQRGKSVW